MKLSDLSKLFFFLIIFLNFSKLFAENEVDIWKKNSNNDTIFALKIYKNTFLNLSSSQIGLL